MRYPADAVAFEYVPVRDSDDSGGAAVDFVLVRGMIIEGTGRCCENCTLIWGQFGADEIHSGGFVAAELRPLTRAAREMLALVEP